MSFALESRPAMTLVDDDFHSARLLTRMLAAHGGPQVEHLPDPDVALGEISARSNVPGDEPMFVIADLKRSSVATRDFVAALNAAAPGVTIVAMAPSLQKSVRDCLLEAGAAAVFERHADVNLYRREAASIIAFWVRGQHLDVVGT